MKQVTSTKKRSARRNRRSGIASFELVMSAPILMFLIAMLYTVYMATMKKSQLTMEVRYNAWLVRTTPNATQTPQLPFGILNAHSSGEAKKELTRTVKTYSNWYPNVPREVKWGNVVLAGSWDYRQVEFKEKGIMPIYPHLDVLVDMVSAQGGVKANSGQVNQLNRLTSMPGLP